MVGCDGPAGMVRDALGIRTEGLGTIAQSVNLFFRSAELSTLHNKGWARFYRTIDEMAGALDKEKMRASLRRTATRKPAELASFLFRDNSFPSGCYLLTGTGIVPENDFTLVPGDEIAITIEPIGTLVNRVGSRESS